MQVVNASSLCEPRRTNWELERWSMVRFEPHGARIDDSPNSKHAEHHAWSPCDLIILD